VHGAVEINKAPQGAIGQAGSAGSISRARSRFALERETEGDTRLVSLQGYALLLIIALTVLAYSPVLFNFFAGDDFVHLTWLRHAVNHPDMIWKNFYSSWLDGTTTKFYRPLISIFMVTDYLVWGINGLGFHLTNLAFHCTSSVLLFFIVRRLAGELKGLNRATPVLLALTSAAVFALYPLHTEAVSWITGRVDAIVTTFCLSSLWCYMRWRDTAGGFWLVGAAASFICGLLSKEMAITTPALFVVYEFIAQPGQSERRPAEAPRTSVKQWVGTGFIGSLRTIPFWAILAAYFVVRRFALGTFVGGYDDSLLFIADPKAFVLNWLHALRVFVEPLNRELFNGRNPLPKIWEVFLLTSIALGAYRLYVERNFKTLAFTCVWLAFALAPVYKLFAIADDLQGSRLAYLATVPLSILFAYGLTGFAVSRNQFSAKMRWILPAVFCALCTTVLFINNQSWRNAGIAANAVRADLDRIYKFIKTDPQFMMIGLPDHIQGAYVCRNALFGMTKKPQISFDAYNCVMVNEFEPIFPFGFLKESMAEHNDVTHVMRWSNKDKQFKLVVIPKQHITETAVFTDAALTTSLHSRPSDNTNCQREGNGALLLSSAGKKRPELAFGLPDTFSSWTTDFITIDINVAERGQKTIGADLLYANEGNPEFQLARRSHAEIADESGHQQLTFVLRSLPEWGLGGNNPRFKLLLPPQSQISIERISVVPASLMMPRIDFANSGYLGSKGYLHLAPKQPKQSISIDASAITGAKSTLLEMTRANIFFEEQNSRVFSNIRGKLMPGPLKGAFKLTRSDFASEGLYEIRVWAVDEHGKTLGVASDHIALAIDP
jgi:hypothetical protein